MADATQSVPGQADVSAGSSQHNERAFHMDQVLGRIATIKLVKIMSVKGGGGGALGKAGAVDMMPLTKQMDGIGGTQSHGTVFGLIYFRYQGGKNAYILDPEVGDMGFAAVCDRDISANKAAGGEAQPGSFRRFSMADGIYLGGVMNAEPTGYVRWKTDGDMIVNIPQGKFVWLGGDPDKGHIFSQVSTVAGPSPFVKARIS